MTEEDFIQNKCTIMYLFQFVYSQE